MPCSNGIAGIAAGIVLAAVVALSGGCRRSGPETTETPAPAPAGAADAGSVAGAPAAPVDGARVYSDYCSVCHMEDGKGVPNMQPALVGSAIVNGDVAYLENVIRGGSAFLGPRPVDVQNEMPPLGFLSDDEIRAVIAYVRGTFGGEGAAGPDSR
jgi:mono/diheme cytochrome c family protein